MSCFTSVLSVVALLQYSVYSLYLRILLRALLPLALRYAGAQFTGFTGTKVQIMTSDTSASAAATPAQVLSLLVFLVQKYKY